MPPAEMPPADWPAMLERAEGLLRAAAPELAAVPPYFVTQAGTAFADSLMHGFTHPMLDCWLKAHLGGRWRGRGIAVVFDDGAGGVAGETPPSMLADRVAALALHEVGHAIADGWGLTRAAAGEPDEGEGERARSVTVPLVAAAVAAAPADTTPADDERDFFGHGERWLRVVLHLRRRVEALGTYLPASRCAGRRPWLSLAETYEWSLGDEPERMAGWPFAGILETPPPAKFAALWQDDLNEFSNATRERNDERK